MQVSVEEMWNLYSVKRRSRRSRPEYRFERAITFDPTVDRHQIFTGVSGRRFPDAGFRVVDVESVVGEAEVSSLQTREPVRKGPNF